PSLTAAPNWSRDPALASRQCGFDYLFFALDKRGDKRNRRLPSLPFPLQPSLVDGKCFAVAQHDSPLDDILQLANVAGPIVSLKQLQCLRPYVPDLFSGHLRVALDQVFDEQRNVVRPLAQRGSLDWEDAQPVEEILAECAHSHGSFQVAVRSSQHAHVHGYRLAAPDPFKFSLLEHAQ